MESGRRSRSAALLKGRSGRPEASEARGSSRTQHLWPLAYIGVVSSLSIAFLGFLLGVRHAVDPDHVVAVGTIATRSSSFRRAAGVGALWGIGHTLTILLVGGGIIVLRVAISPRAGLAMEFAVAIMLILLGLQNVATARRNEDREPSAARPFLVGMVHGMAGSAAVVLLVLATVRD